MAIVEYKNVSKYYDKNCVINSLNLSIAENDFLVVFGLPGCGKSVLMRLLMGLEQPDTGTLFLRGQDAADIRPGDRNIGYVPQSFALMSHLTVYNNIAYPLKLEKAPKDVIEREVMRVAGMLHIEDLLQKRPDQTSGGQKQRIAIARGIIKKTDVYVFDDPLVGLDFKLREQLVDDLRELQEVIGATFIYTTSDSLETLQLAKNVALFNGGKIVEQADPFTLYDAPQREESMRILGFPNANIVKGNLSNGSLKTDVFTADIPRLKDKSGEVSVGIRPEHFSLQSAGGGEISLDAVVSLREDLGGEEILYFDINKNTLIMMVWHHDEKESLEIGSKIKVYVKTDDIICFDAQSGERL